MKKGVAFIFLTLSLSGILNAGMRSLPQPAETGAVIQFDMLVHDFGELREGDIKTCVFKFANKGDAPLIVEYVEQPCGCTVPSWSKEPVMPGKTGEIKVIYNSKDRPGIFRKTLAVKTNAISRSKDPLMLMVKGNVLTKKEWKQKYKTNKS